MHPVLPYLLTSSDDMLIKLWDWDKGWGCVQVFEGHSHYVMQVVFNPKDTNTFASASLDRTVKVRKLGKGLRMCCVFGCVHTCKACTIETCICLPTCLLATPGLEPWTANAQFYARGPRERRQLC